MGMYSMGDFSYDDSNADRCWQSLPPNPALQPSVRERRTPHHLTSITPALKLVRDFKCPPLEAIVLAPMQCWLRFEGNLSVVYEILEIDVKYGENPEDDTADITVRRWTHSSTCRDFHTHRHMGMLLHIDSTSPSHGAGTPLVLTYQQLFPTNRAIKAYLTPDVKEGYDDLYRKIVRLVNDVSPDLPYPAPKYAHRVSLEIQKAIGDYRGPLDIFTDGSWSQHKGMLDSIFHPEKAQTKAGASLVII